MLSVIHTNIRKTAMPRTGRTLDALVTGASGAGGGSIAAQGEQYWEIVTVGPDGAQLAQEDYYLRPRQDLNVVSQRNLIAYGDVIAKSVDEEIEDAELPKAGYGITNFGLTAIKQGGGLLVDSNNLVYIDPNYAGGGLDIEQLEQYLTTNGYLKLHDPATSLLMTGYIKAGAYSPIQATDNLSVAIGKLEKHFDDYVTLATAQTITGAKIFTQDVISQGDIIAKSTSEAISDAELPIASKTQLGLIKVGSGFDIAADGTINNTGGSGLTEVFWTDIKKTPTTLAGYGITDALGKNETAVAASKLSPGCKIWGQALTGEKDITGALTDVTNITMTGSIKIAEDFNILKGDNWIIGANSQGQLLLNATGNIINMGYRGTTGLAFYGGATEAGEIGTGLGFWNTDRLYIATSLGINTGSPQAKLHVVGDGRFNGQVISTTNKAFRSVYGNYGVFFQNDGNKSYFLVTDSGDQYGSFNSYRPMQIYHETGGVSFARTIYCKNDGGNTGFGTSSPSAKVHVIGDGLFTGDVICKSTSTAISDDELPIASKTQLGLIKIGSGFDIAADGTLNNTGTGGLTEVFWDDIKNPPTTLAGYGITDALSINGVAASSKKIEDSNKDLGTSNGLYYHQETNYAELNPDTSWYHTLRMFHTSEYEVDVAFSFYGSVKTRYKSGGTWYPWRQFAFTDSTVAAASKLSPGCKIWGKAFTGESDITGTLQNVDNIYMSGYIYLMPKVTGGWARGMVAVSSANKSLGYVAGVHVSSDILAYYFYGGMSFDDASIYILPNKNVGFGISNPQDKVHVNGNGRFSGEVRSTSNKAFRSVYGDYGVFFQNNGKESYLLVTNSGDQYGSFNSFRPITIYHETGGVSLARVIYCKDDGGNTGFGTSSPQAKVHVIGDGLFTGDVIAKSTSTAISDAELPIASANTFGLIKVGSTLRISNGVLDVAGGSGGGGSIVTWGTTSNGVARLTVDGTYKDVSLSGHTHSQYLTSHQAIYKLTIQKNGVTVGTYTPNVGTATINITTSGGGSGWASGTYTDNGVCLVNNNGGGGLAFWNDTEKTGLRVGGGNGIKGYNDTYGHLGNLFFNYVSSSVNVKVDAYGKIYSNGTALSSDLRLKEVVGYESDVLERMTKIPVIKFYRKDVGDNVQTTGFGAQSFQGIFDNVTILNNDSGYYMISETSILGITFQGVKELYTLQKQTTNEIDVLKQRIALLEAENQNLWNLINEKEAA